MDREMTEAVARGYMTNKQRREWGSDRQAAFGAALAQKQEEARLAYENGDSNARLLELVRELADRVQWLEQREAGRG